MTKTVIANTKHIYQLAAYCFSFGVRTAVVCPGSRCAPLLLAFANHPDIETISVTDERSAGFVAFGIAEQSQTPVVLICTSGTAAQNLAPAVTEAFYQQVPLLVLTADRPACWIDQWDGQIIHQTAMFEPHVKASLTYIASDCEILATEALSKITRETFGPVHMNVPIEEPFYPQLPEDSELLTLLKSQSIDSRLASDTFTFPYKKAFSDPLLFDENFWCQLKTSMSNYKKILLLGGQSIFDEGLYSILYDLRLPVAGDVISNLHQTIGVFCRIELMFKHAGSSLRPDLLITFGRSIISKSLKLFLRRFKPKAHWHVGQGMVGDPFSSLSWHIQTSVSYFFLQWCQHGLKPASSHYYALLQAHQQKVTAIFEDVLRCHPFCAMHATEQVINSLPEDSVLHLGNSMPVRMIDLFGVAGKSVKVYCNRGTSGIDGTVSTAVGHALADTEHLHTLLVGDLAFLYDRNGLWLNHPFPSNLRIIVLNDFCGGIFKVISGPSDQGRLLELFTTPHTRKAQFAAVEFNLFYAGASTISELNIELSVFKAGILEVFVEADANKRFFDCLNNKLNTANTFATLNTKRINLADKVGREHYEVEE